MQLKNPFIYLLVLTLTSCASTVEEPLSYEVLEEIPSCSIPSRVRSSSTSSDFGLIIESDADLKELLGENFDQCKKEGSSLLSQIDFKQEVLVGLVGSTGCAGGDIEIESVERRDKTVSIYAKVNSKACALPAISWPTLYLKVNDTSSNYEFLFTEGESTLLD